MYITRSYFPFLETSTRTISGYKINVYDVYDCILYPRMQAPSLLHISAVFSTPAHKALAVSDLSGTHVCDIMLQHDDGMYHGIAMDRCGYCGELVLSKEAYDAFHTIPEYLEIDANAFIFDPSCVIYRPLHNSADVLMDHQYIDAIEFRGENISTSGDVVELVDNRETVTKTPITSINGHTVKQLIITHTPTSSVRVDKASTGDIVIGRMTDL